jgi:signal recognition particle subunit SRP54
MGSLKKMLGMLPGMAQLRDQLENFDEREMDRVEAIIKSMTPLERRRPSVLNGSRKMRVAKGSGVQVQDVNQLIERFGEAQKMMRQLRRGGMPGMPGMPGLGGGGKKSKGRTAPPPRKGKAKSGNPAKRAQQEREAAQRGAAGASSAPGGAFGLGGGMPDPAELENLQLPPGFEKFLGR